MSYSTIAIMARDNHLKLRIAACAAEQGKDSPVSWAESQQWHIAASPGWDDAWAYAAATGVADIGKSEVVVSDGMILAAVQARIAE